MAPRNNSDSFIGNSPQSIGAMTRPGGGNFYMKNQGPPNLHEFGRDWPRGLEDFGKRSVWDYSDIIMWRALGPFKTSVPVHEQLDDSMGHGPLTQEDSGGY